MKKTILMMIAGVAMGVWAATAEHEGVTYEYEVSGGNATITKATTGDAKIVNIPSSLGGYTVTAISGNVFQDNTTVQKVVIPESVTRIGDSAFAGCIALTACNIPSDVMVIPNNCFSGCTKLRRIVLPDGIKTIGYKAFSGCSSLESIVFPVELEKIFDEAFSFCSSFLSIDLPNSVMSIGNRCFYGCVALEMAHLPVKLKQIPTYLFWNCHKLHTVNIPDGVTAIFSYAFLNCYSLCEVTVPASVTQVENGAFSGVGQVVFLGRPPAGLASAGFSTAVYPKEYGELWAAQISIAKTGGFVKPNRPVVTVLSAAVRENDPTVLDVVYKVTSSNSTVKVRALAFEDGVRSFANVTRPETFIDGTAANIGDAVAANVEHTLSWKVSSDFQIDLAKMKFEVLAVEDGILPLELTAIPANGANRAMELSWNVLTEAQVFDALLWLYADGDSGLTLANGALRNGATQLANGTSITAVNAVQYAFTTMGFSKLTGDALTYANAMTRFGLAPSGIRQYAYRWIEAQ